jgi:hypothetical protein
LNPHLGKICVNFEANVLKIIRPRQVGECQVLELAPAALHASSIVSQGTHALAGKNNWRPLRYP